MAATASPTVSSTVGLKNVVIAPLTEDTEATLTYGELQLMAGAIEASVTPENADPDVQYPKSTLTTGSSWTYILIRVSPAPAQRSARASTA